MKKRRRSLIVLTLVLIFVSIIATAIFAQGRVDNDSSIPFGFVATAFSTDFSLSYDLSTHTLASTPTDLQPDGDGPFSAVMHPNKEEVWITGSVGDGVVILDAQTNAVVDRISGIGDWPVDIEFSKDGSLAYISIRRNPPNIMVVDANTYRLIESIPLMSDVDSNPEAGHLALNPCTGELYMVNYFDGELWRVDPVTREVTEELPAFGTSLWNLMVDPQAERLYVTDRKLRDDKLHVLDISGSSFVPITSIPLDDDPWGIDVSPDGQTIVVANKDGNNVQIIDATTLAVTKTVTLAVPGSPDTPEPLDVEISENGRFAYVPSNDVGNAGNDDEDAVLVVDLQLGEQVDAIGLGSVRDPVVVSVAPPAPSLDPIPNIMVTTPVVLGTVVQFTDLSGNEPVAWAWDFGDGVGSSTLQNPIYNYANPGTYVVTMTATNHCGSQTATTEVEVLGNDWTTFLPVILRPE